MNNEIIAYLPELTTAAGLAGGIIIDRLALKHANAGRQAVLHTQGLTEEEFKNRHQGVVPETSSVNVKTSKRQYIDRAIIPIATGLAAGLATVAFVNQTEKHPIASAGVRAIVDQSADVGYDGSETHIRSLMEELDQTGHIKIQATIAHDGTDDAISIKRLAEAKDQIWGPPSVDQALSSTLTSSFDPSGSNKQSNAGRPALLIVTDNNTIGAKQTVEAQARADGNIPIFIDNVGNNSDQTAKELKQTAKDTNGEYWDGQTATPNVIPKLESAVASHEEIEFVDSSKFPEQMLSVLALAALLGAIKTRAEVRFKRRKD